MEKIKQKILQTQFRTFWKRFFILSLVVVLLGGITVAFCFRTQITQGSAYLRQLHTEKDAQAHLQDAPRHGKEWTEDKLWESAPIAEPTLGAKLALCGYGLLCCVIFGAYWLAFAAWLYQASVKARMRGLLWLLLGLGGNIFAGILFLLVRSLLRKSCPVCGAWLQTKARFCPHCGADLFRRCPSCGKECGSEERFCSACGQSLQSEAAN